jgi:NADPH:quinone reductase-like Zn-dependent oxidoreductase
MAQKMKAIVRKRYGSVQLQEIDKPEPADNEVLVRVHAASLNRFDWYRLTGRPWLARIPNELRKPKSHKLGSDFAGTVEAVGKDVTQFRPGDEVFGGRTGSLAEYMVVPEDGGIARKPPGASFEEAAALPVAGVTALQGLRDKGEVQAGQAVLVNGASGGVGTFAVQIAKALGADVTAVCSTRNVEQSRSLGADRVIDYTREDFTQNGKRYDVFFDNAGSRPWSECKRVLKADATVVLVGGPKKNRLLGPLGHIIGMRLGSKRAGHKTAFFMADLSSANLEALGELLEAGQLKPVIERRYELSEAADALRYMGEGHAQGKVVVALAPSDSI